MTVPRFYLVKRGTGGNNMSKVKKIRRTDEEKQQFVLDLVMMDDIMFESMCEDPCAVEEMLQTMLNEPNLRIKYDTLVAQKSIRNLRGRSIRMDAYVAGQEDKVFNVEIQKSDNCNHVKRVRYNASLITVQNSEPGDDFEDIQELCVIYITKNDIFDGGLTVYHVQNTIQETGRVIDNGFKEVYINAEIKDGSKISKLMDVFQLKVLDEDVRKIFPNTFKKFQSLKYDKKEVDRMCDKVEAYAKEYAKEESISNVIEALDRAGLPREEVISNLSIQFNLSKEDAEAYYDDMLVTA